MKEQSHKHEMSAAILGDFRRLRERGVAATLAPRDDDRAGADPVDVPAEPEPGVELEPRPEPVLGLEQAADPPVARRGLLVRLRDRR